MLVKEKSAFCNAWISVSSVVEPTKVVVWTKGLASTILFRRVTEFVEELSVISISEALYWTAEFSVVKTALSLWVGWLFTIIEFTTCE